MTEGALIGFREFSPEKEEERAEVKVGVKERCRKRIEGVKGAGRE